MKDSPPHCEHTEMEAVGRRQRGLLAMKPVYCNKTLPQKVLFLPTVSSESGQLYMQPEAFCVHLMCHFSLIVSILLNLGTLPCLVMIFFILERGSGGNLHTDYFGFVFYCRSV